MSLWRTANPDWESAIRNGTSLVPPLPIFEDEAEKALRIFKRLRVPDIEGNPTHGEVCEPWVFDLVRVIFGSYDVALKQRMIREFFLLIPKKNGKSSIAAAVIVTAALMNRRPEAELLLIAPTKMIANIAFKQAKGIIRLDQALTKLFHIQEHIKTITHRRTLAQIQIKAADTDAITGSKATFVLIDETHVFAAMAKADQVFIEVRGGLAARPDGFLLQITTQSKEPPAGVFKAELAKARDVRDGKLEMALLPILYELPADLVAHDNWKRRENWKLVNPNLGISVSEDYLVDQLTAAEREGIGALALLASQHFNVEVGIGLRTDRWAGADHWLKAADRTITLDALLERSEVVAVGIDGGGLDDLLGLAVLGRERGTRRWLLWCRAWAHDCVLTRRKEIAPRLIDFRKEETLTVLPDDSDEDVTGVVDVIEQVHQSGLLAQGRAIGVDPVGIVQILDEIRRRGFDVAERVEPVRQGWTMSDKIKSTERQLAAGNLIHDGSALMTWCVGNAKVEPRGNAILITKAVSGSAKIDPLIAAFNAVDIMARDPVAGAVLNVRAMVA
ncbi:terminase large subunit [Enterovirga rhinocerotis]|uniref:Phage terminase large subunit-like protein n=1 Tax=Enterovirga rhinocerotis TaxID=1339210 RepID=A0A4R7BXR5_9HYPH|nr:terminase large subunit [Enterovirga rhinocerotis]TDR90303.1 phage terminase large subunit-like protein [Enterovirga rhinocerotis]